MGSWCSKRAVNKAENQQNTMSHEQNVSDTVIAEAVYRGLQSFAESTNGKGLLAIDFDATIVQVHTYGRWSGSASSLAAHVRPVFRVLLNAAVRMDNLNVSIVTFSGQIALIRSVLGIVIGSEDLANRVHIRGSDRSWPIPPNVPVEGKSPHIASVVESIRETQGTDRVPEPHHILLIDDDKKNIKQAQRVGFKAVAFPELPLPGIHMNSLPEGRGLNVVYRSQLRHGTLLCISSGSVVSFDGGAKGCIVNAANEDGLGGGGVDGAISQAGGRELYSDRLALTVENIEGREVRIPTGTAKITGPRRYGSLRVPCVIHAVGPCYQEFERDESTLAVGDKLLVDAYISSMDLARRSNIELLAFSLLSAGVFRGSRSLEHVLEIAVRATVRKVYEGLREVHLVAFSNTEIECLLSIVRRLENNHDDQILGAGQSTEIIQFLEDLNLMCTTTFH